MKIGLKVCLGARGAIPLLNNISIKNMITENKEEFLSSHEIFVNKHGSVKVDINKYFTLVQKNHQNIRKLIGGLQCEMLVKLQTNQKPIDKQCGSLIKEIQQLVPDFAPYANKTYGTDKTMAELLSKPTMPNGTHSSVRVSKVLSTYARDYVKNVEKIKEINKKISELGLEWGKYRTDNIDLKIEMLTNAQAFTNLGYYEVDNDSCWQQTAGNAINKYQIGISPDTFVILIKDTKDNILARMWGFLSEDNVFNTSNYYFKPKFNEGNAIESLKGFFAELLSTKSEKIYWNENLIMMEGVPFHNKYARWSFSKEETPKEQILVCDTFDGRIICPICKRGFENKKDWTFIDEKLTCPKCQLKALLCPVLKKSTFNKIHAVIAKGDLVLICQDALELPEFEQSCRHCGYVTHKDAFSEDGSKCLRCAGAKKNKWGDILLPVPEDDFDDEYVENDDEEENA